MTLDTLLSLRRSVRGYRPEPLPETVLERVFSLAQQSPSNCNVQPWVTHLVSGDTLARLRERLVTAALDNVTPEPDFNFWIKYQSIGRQRQVEAGQALYAAMNIARDDRAGRDAAFRRNLACFDAPHAVFLFMHQDYREPQAVDIGIYAQTLMLALTAEGVASCAQGALALYSDIVRDTLGVSAEHRLLLGLSFGYEDTAVPANAARTTRADWRSAVTCHA